MAIVISSLEPFPAIDWWLAAAPAGNICFDRAEHLQKMSYRNRYYIAGANGAITLSVPLEGGRNQRTAMSQVRISQRDRWQVNHWRTIVSAYKRSAYFDHYEPSLQRLFEQEFALLADFNLASFQWLQAQLQLDAALSFADSYQAAYPEGYTDLRHRKPGIANGLQTAGYYQVFEDRTGFIPNLSLLDLLFAEGPYTLRWLREQAAR